jgi:cell division protein FtsB
VKSLQSEIDTLKAEIRNLNDNPDNLPKSVVAALIREIRLVELPRVRAALEEAKHSLQRCRQQ